MDMKVCVLTQNVCLFP